MCIWTGAIQHRTVVIILPLILQTIIIAQTLSNGGEGSINTWKCSRRTMQEVGKLSSRWRKVLLPLAQNSSQTPQESLCTHGITEAGHWRQPATTQWGGEGLTSHSTHYRSFRGRFLQARWLNQVSKPWRKPVGRQRSGLNPTRTTTPCYNNTTLGNCLYTRRKGPNVINPYLFDL